MYINEEEVKNKIVLPYLEKLGIENDDLEFETNFKIYLPRKEMLEISGKVSNEKNVFSDILVKANINGIKRNLFIIEVKRFEHILNEKDIQQGITYARLLEQIAPYTIITNGKNTLLYDTLECKEVINVEENKLNVTISEEIKNEAYRSFVGIDIKNMMLVCDRISEMNWKDFVSKERSDKCVNIDLQINRKKYLDDLCKYAESNSHIYGLVGKSGIGKTNILYSFWKKQKEKNPILFYNAAVLDKDIKEKLCDDLEFMFGRNRSFNEWLTNIKQNICENKLIIIIDGIDERNNTVELRNQLNDLVKKIIDSNIILIISCKISDSDKTEWMQLTKNNGANNTLGDEIYKASSNYDSNINACVITEMLDEEINDFWKIFAKEYNVLGNINGEAKELAKTPIILKMLCEVYQGKKIDNEVSEKLLYEKWTNQKLNLTSDYNFTMTVLKKIINDLVDNSAWHLTDQEIYKNFSYSEKAIEAINELLRINILQLRGSQYRVINEYLQEYIYCYMVKEWNKKSVIEMEKVLNDDLGNNYLIPYIIFYFGTAESFFYEYKDEGTVKCNCENCKKEIAEGEMCTIAIRLINGMKEKKIIDENNLVNRYVIVHKKCMNKLSGFMVINTKEEYSYISGNDYEAFLKIKKILGNKENLQRIALNSEIDKAIKYNKYISMPKIKDVGEPFYAIMRFINNINTGDFFSIENSILWFNNKELASRYYNFHNVEKEEDIGDYKVVGLTKKYILELRNYFVKKGITKVDILVVNDVISKEFIKGLNRNIFEL